MIKTLGVVCLACVLPLAGTAQQAQRNQKTQAARTAQAGGNNPQSQANAATVRNDRQALMPRVGYSGNIMPDQNRLVGCIAARGQDLVLHQPELDRTYELRGNQAQLRASQGKMVEITGRLVLGTPAAFNVKQLQVVQPKCNYAATRIVSPITGGTGEQGAVFNVTSTTSIGQTTPGTETQAGVRQNPAMAETVQTYGANPGPGRKPTESLGAPPNVVIENPVDAQRIADAAAQPELNGGAQLGINAQPNYSTANNAQQNQQAVTNQAQQVRGQASASTQVLQGGATGRQANEAPPEGVPGTMPVFIGCLTAQNGRQILIERASGQHFLVDASGKDLGQYLNHEVRIFGNQTGTYGPAIATDGNTATVHIDAIQTTGACSQQ